MILKKEVIKKDDGSIVNIVVIEYNCEKYLLYLNVFVEGDYRYCFEKISNDIDVDIVDVKYIIQNIKTHLLLNNFLLKFNDCKIHFVEKDIPIVLVFDDYGCFQNCVVAVECDYENYIQKYNTNCFSNEIIYKIVNVGGIPKITCLFDDGDYNVDFKIIYSSDDKSRVKKIKSRNKNYFNIYDSKTTKIYDEKLNILFEYDEFCDIDLFCNFGIIKSNLTTKFGIIKDFKITIPIIYDEIVSISELNYIFSSIYKYSGLFVVKYNNHYGVINSDNDIIVDFNYTHYEKIRKEIRLSNPITLNIEDLIQENNMIYNLKKLYENTTE